MSLAKDNPYYANPSDYEDDVYSWSYEQAQLLRLGRFSEVDIANVIEEIESLGREMKSLLTVHYRDLIAAFLEWQYAPPENTIDLEKTILDARFGIQQEERESKSLHDSARRLVDDAYPVAARLAVVATGLPPTTFPIECPYGLALLRDLDAMPPPISGDRS